MLLSGARLRPIPGATSRDFAAEGITALSGGVSAAAGSV